MLPIRLQSGPGLTSSLFSKVFFSSPELGRESERNMGLESLISRRYMIEYYRETTKQEQVNWGVCLTLVGSDS